MKVSKVVLGVALAGTLTVASMTMPALAWHPEGVITKKVQNITTGSALSEADTVTAAVAAKPGDVLKYVIEVKNVGKPASNGHNDMAKTVMTDTLPSGIELVSNPAQRQITEDLGLIKPGESKVKEYTVKVTASKDGAIQNTACFTGDSTVNDSPQKGCNPAVITVKTPPVVPEPPKTPETPKPPVTPTTPTELPKTGLGESILGSAFALGIGWYVAHRYIMSRRDLAKYR